VVRLPKRAGGAEPLSNLVTVGLSCLASLPPPPFLKLGRCLIPYKQFFPYPWFGRVRAGHRVLPFHWPALEALLSPFSLALMVSFPCVPSVESFPNFKLGLPSPAPHVLVSRLLETHCRMARPYPFRDRIKLFLAIHLRVGKFPFLPFYYNSLLLVLWCMCTDSRLLVTSGSGP